MYFLSFSSNVPKALVQVPAKHSLLFQSSTTNYNLLYSICFEQHFLFYYYDT
jgi:hypothetical protein